MANEHKVVGPIFQNTTFQTMDNISENIELDQMDRTLYTVTPDQEGAANISKKSVCTIITAIIAVMAVAALATYFGVTLSSKPKGKSELNKQITTDSDNVNAKYNACKCNII